MFDQTYRQYLYGLHSKKDSCPLYNNDGCDTLAEIFPVRKYVSNETKVNIITESIENDKHDTKKRKKEITI